MDIKSSLFFLESFENFYDIPFSDYNVFINTYEQALRSKYKGLFDITDVYKIDILPYIFAVRYLNCEKSLYHIFKSCLQKIQVWKDIYESKGFFEIAGLGVYETILVISFLQKILI